MMRTQIVQTVTATSMAELRRRRDAAVDGDLVELRLDGVADLDVAGALAGRTRPVVVTCRPVWEGGRWAGDEAGRRAIMAAAVEAGAEYVDMERRAGWLPDLRGTSTRLVVSDHDFHGVPSDLVARVQTMRALGAHIVKVAVMASRVTDVVHLRSTLRAAGSGPDLVCIAMGDAGQLTRLLPAHFGSCWTYGGDAAPGQVSASQLRERYRVHTVSAETRIWGVAGSPIAHSASPAMHNAAMAAEGFDGVYVPVFARTVEEAATVVEAFGFEGLSLTAPLKSGWGDRADVVYDDEASRRLGAVNTLKRTDGKWLARNLDVAGFLDPLDERRIAIAGRSALVLGAGGAARAAAWVLGQRGAAVTIAARREDAARHLASALGATVTTWPPTGRWDLIVNATPAGTWPAQDVMPVEWGALQTPVAYDLVYNPELTRWLDGAAQAGAQVIGGLDMLVGQAVRQREWWTRQAADAQVMRAAARAFVQETTGS